MQECIFQRELEHKAFVAGGENFNAPVQRVCDFIENKASTKICDVKPSVGPDFTPTDLNKCLPDFITNSMRQAIVQMDKKLHGFSYGDAVLTGVETRSSSPIRIMRNNNLQKYFGSRTLSVRRGRRLRRRNYICRSRRN